MGGRDRGALAARRPGEAALRESLVETGDPAVGGYAVSAVALEQGFDMTANSANPILRTRRVWQTASAKGGLHLDVELSCADPAAHPHTLATRAPRAPGLVLPGWEALCARRSEAFPEADLHLDTGALSVPEAVGAIPDALGARPHG
ncbi:hypothetical protein [Dinoroseobacter sp. S124A]|uniref:hypothetical protein n=1 Tax=Dinoroseobacter sp. S124A TaxID=3415128 RepID=UPI003C7B704D